MADETQKLYIEVKVNAETGKLDIVNGALVKLDTTAAKSAKGGIKQLGSALGFTMGAATGWIAVAVAIIKVIKDSVENEEKEVQRQRQLKTTLDSLKLGYDKHKTAIDNNLKSLIAHTKFMRGEAYDAYNKAVVSQNSIKGGYKLVKIAMDEASRTGKPLNEVMETLTGALAGGARGTKVLKDEFGALVGKGKNAAEMIENAGKAINGTAKHEDDLSTQTKGLKEMFISLSTSIGKSLMPVINVFITVLKVVLVPVLISVQAAIATIKITVDTIVGQVKIILAFLTGGLAAAATQAKNSADKIKKDLTDAFKDTKDEMTDLFQTQKTGSADAGNTLLHNVVDPLEKVEDKTKETKDAMEKSFDEIAKNIQNTLGAELDKTFKNMVDEGKFTKQGLNDAFTGIYQSFRDMLIKMVAELIARQAIIGVLTMLSGRGVEFAASMLKDMVAPAVGSFAVGSSNVPRTGNYLLHQGETVGKPGSGNGGNTYIIQAGVSAFDTRSVSNNDMARLARQLTPHLKKELDKIK